MERESRHWKSKVSKRKLDSGKEKRLLITPIFMIEGTPSKSAFFVNGTISGYVPTNVRNSRHISTYEPFVKIRKYINCINSSHVETIVALHRTDM